MNLKQDNKNLKKHNFDAVQIRIASPEKIRSWSKGEVVKPETLNYRTLKPEKDGLFCERIFGPEKDYECSCGRYKKRSQHNIICDRCGVEVTSSRVRRERLGHIELAVPVGHIWYVKNSPSKIAAFLGDIGDTFTLSKLEKVLYYDSYIVIDPGEEHQHYKKYELIDVSDYNKLEKLSSTFKADIGAEAIKKLLAEIDIEERVSELKTAIFSEPSTLKKQKLIKKLKIADAFLKSGNRPEWMILEVLPVLPPTLRPLVALDGGRFATADFNDLYRRVITRNNRLKNLIELHAPEVIIRNEKRLLQESVDGLIDNSRKSRPIKGRGARVLKSLTDQLKGKQGRFRQNLLGKRVDYSGRSVIVVSPTLKIHQCGLPKDMVLDLFKPYIIERLERIGEVEKTKNAKKYIERKPPKLWKVLEEVIEDYPVLLNRAPTLHKLGIQGFMPVLTEGKAIELHPMVCTPFNADFDGDQMAVYVPLSQEAQIEARTLMLASRNLLLPANGKLAMAASQDIVLGCFYLTVANENQKPEEKSKKVDLIHSLGHIMAKPISIEYNNDESEPSISKAKKTIVAHDYGIALNIPAHTLITKPIYELLKKGRIKQIDVLMHSNYQDQTPLRMFSNTDEVVLAYEYEENLRTQKNREQENSRLNLHTWIKIRFHEFIEEKSIDKVNKIPIVTSFLTTVGRVIFNAIIPEGISFQNYPFDKGKLNEIAMLAYDKVGQARTAIFLDDMKELGFKYATRAGVTFSFSDIIVPAKKQEILNETEKEVKKIFHTYERGGITEKERAAKIIDKWKTATEKVSEELMKELEQDRYGFNSIYLMYLSGARGGKDQIKQLGGMRGLMAKPTRIGAEEAEVIETPIKSNFREGLTVLEYFISTHGARKGLADTALKTAEAGYLTRRLVDVAQNCIITEDDCGTMEGMEVGVLRKGIEIIQNIKDRIYGRFAAEDIIDPNDSNAQPIVKANEYITAEAAQKIQERGIQKAIIRAVLTCESKKGICQKCYGKNLGNNKLATLGDPVGIIAAQSIGEPGTQLTLRTFHIGGAASTAVEVAEVESDYDGFVVLEEKKGSKTSLLVNFVETQNKEYISVSHLGKIKIVNNDQETLFEYKVPYAAKIHVRHKDSVNKGDLLFSWDSYNTPTIATTEGFLRYDNFEKDKTFKEEFNEITGKREITIIDSKIRNKQPQFIISKKTKSEAENMEYSTTSSVPKVKKGSKSQISKGSRVLKEETNVPDEEKVPLQPGMIVEVDNGAYVFPGDILGKSSRTTVKQGDITGGLPRVQDLFEARTPKDKAILSFISGRVTIGDLTKLGRIIYVHSESGEEEKYVIPLGKRIIVHQGDMIESGDALSDGALDPHDILTSKGIKAAQRLILDEIQEVYRKQGVKIDDKHISIIIRQMFKKVRIIDPGHTNFLEGEVVEKELVLAENKRVENEEIKDRKGNKVKGEGATFDQLLLGITKSSLMTESWLSAAAFQETTKVLVDAAIEGKIDYLEGLKESIIIGHRIPVGTGTRSLIEKVVLKQKEGKTMSEIIQHFAHSESLSNSEDNIEAVLDY